MYQLIVEDKQFVFYDFNSIEPECSNPKLNALSIETHKLFSNDVVDHTGDLIHSYIRSGEIVPGVLILNGNRTYGKNENGKRLLYKCIPDNRELPAFLIPYDLKLGFSKDVKNKYIVFKYDHWNDKHPRGTIVETLGDVNELSVYYEYKLYCRNIHDSISCFTCKTRELVKQKTDLYDSVVSNPKFAIEKRLDVPVFSIDPTGCTDIDDAFSIHQLPDDSGYKISIYIANVFVWMDALGLWDQIDTRVSTIYLPDKRRTMLPTILSENLCSLLEKQNRIAFCMDVYIDSDGKNIREPEYKNVEIKVHSNFAYEEPKMRSNKYYKMMLDVTRKMKNDVNDSHDVIEYWMIYMNSMCGERLASNKNGVFRTATISENTTNKFKKIIRDWNDVNCKYMPFSCDADISHQVLKINSYVHITSPIRRLVDLLNQTIFIQQMGIAEISSDAVKFIDKWKQKIEYVNMKTKSIRKVQTDCNTMSLCHDNPDMLTQTYNGVVFNKINRNDGSIGYSVYIESLKIFSKIKTQIDLPEYSEANFKLYYFGDEYDNKRKLRFQFISECIE
jgi:hypothetical protein